MTPERLEPPDRCPTIAEPSNAVLGPCLPQGEASCAHVFRSHPEFSRLFRCEACGAERRVSKSIFEL
jgi:hypothetical protein